MEVGEEIFFSQEINNKGGIKKIQTVFILITNGKLERMDRIKLLTSFFKVYDVSDIFIIYKNNFEELEETEKEILNKNIGENFEFISTKRYNSNVNNLENIYNFIINTMFYDDIYNDSNIEFKIISLNGFTEEMRLLASKLITYFENLNKTFYTIDVKK